MIYVNISLYFENWWSFYTLLKFRYRADLLFWHFYLGLILFRARHRCENTFFLKTKWVSEILKRRRVYRCSMLIYQTKATLKGWYIYTLFIHFELNIYKEGLGGGMWLHCIFHVQCSSKSSNISDSYATHWKFSYSWLDMIEILWYVIWWLRKYLTDG